eukprot:scaffold20778_cov69-Phaeocystis_antarctica.AAC.8
MRDGFAVLLIRHLRPGALAGVAMIVQPGLLRALVGFRGLVNFLDGLGDQLDGAQRARVDGDGGGHVGHHLAAVGLHLEDDAVLGDLVVVVLVAAAAAAPPGLGICKLAVVEVPGHERVAVRLDLGLANLAHTGLVVALVRGHHLSLGVAHTIKVAVVGRDRPRELILISLDARECRLALEARPARGELQVGEAHVLHVAES